MIKICSPQLGISPYSTLGGEVYDYQTLKGFTKKGFKVFVLLPKGREYDQKLKNFIIEFATLKHIFPPIIYSFFILPYLFRLYKTQKFEVLRIHSPRFLGLGALIFHIFHPEVAILSSGITVDSPKIYYPIERWVYFISQAIIVQSGYMKKHLIRKYKIIDKDKIFITFGGRIDQPLKITTKPAESVLISDKDYLIVFMGALIKRKNPKFALKVFISLKEKLPQVKMLFIGRGEQRKALDKIIKNANLEDKVIFINRSVGSQKAYWFSRMNLFFCPSLDEGFGLVVTEAMSFKKVVITSNKAAFPEIIENNIDGFCLKLNKKEWVETSIKILKNPNLATKIGERAKRKVDEQFSWQRTYNLNANVVKNII